MPGRHRAHNINPKGQCDIENNVQQPAPVCKTKSQYYCFVEAAKLSIIHVNNNVDNTVMQPLFPDSSLRLVASGWVINPKYFRDRQLQGGLKWHEGSVFFQAPLVRNVLRNVGGFGQEQ